MRQKCRELGSWHCWWVMPNWWEITLQFEFSVWKVHFLWNLILSYCLHFPCTKYISFSFMLPYDFHFLCRKYNSSNLMLPYLLTYLKVQVNRALCCWRWGVGGGGGENISSVPTLVMIAIIKYCWRWGVGGGGGENISSVPTLVMIAIIKYLQNWGGGGGGGLQCIFKTFTTLYYFCFQNISENGLQTRKWLYSTWVCLITFPLYLIIWIL